MLKIKRFIFNPFGMNTYIVFDPSTHDAIVVDPGMVSPAENKLFDDYVKDNGLHIKQIVNTHLHLDHCFGDNYVRDKYGVKVAAHIADAPLGASIGSQARQFGIFLPNADGVSIDVPLKDGDIITIGDNKLKVIHVPGHSPGGIALYSDENRFVIVGDILFRGSIGRTDLPRGNHDMLINGIKQKILTLPSETAVLPGHESPTSIGAEKDSNPYLR